MPLLIDTNQLDPGERSEALQAVLTSATAPHDLRLLGPPDQVHARLEHWQLSPDVTCSAPVHLWAGRTCKSSIDVTTPESGRCQA